MRLLFCIGGRTLNRIERKLDKLNRKVDLMALDEAAFDAALAEFVTTLGVALDAIKAKLDSLGSGVDFSDELATLDQASTTLKDFVAANAAPPPPE